MRFSDCLKACLMLVLLPCLMWAANLTVTVTDANGSAVSGADVAAVAFSSMGPVGSSLSQTDASGNAVLTLTNNLMYQVVAVKSGYLPAAKDQMFDWRSSFNAGTTDASKTVSLRAVASTDKVKDIMITVTHDAAAGQFLFLNLMNKGTYQQAGMGFFKSAGAGNPACYIYSAPTSSSDYPYQLDVYNPESRRGSRVDVNNKPDHSVAEDASSLNIASTNSGAMGPPTRQVETDEKLGKVVIEGRALVSGSDTGIEDVNVNIHDNTDNSVNLNTQTDQNGYYAFYESADAANKIFQGGHRYSVNLMKNGYVGAWTEITYAANQASTMTVSMLPVNGKIKGAINIVTNGTAIPIPQAWVNAWGDGRNYGTSEDWNNPGCDRKMTMGNASGPVEKGKFLLSGLPSGRFILNIWSEFNNQPISYNNGADGNGAVDSNKWDTANSNWRDDLIVEIDTGTNGGYAKVFTAATPHTEVTTAYDAEGNITINITKNPDGTNYITGSVTFLDAASPIDPSTVLIVARENWKNDGTQPKSGFTVLKAADRVSDSVYNYRIEGLADAMYRIEIKAPGYGLKVDNGQRPNENITLSKTGAASSEVNLRMAPAGIIEGILRTPKGTIYVPKFDGPDNSNANVNANGNETNCWGGSQIGKDGKFRIEGLLPGKYQLQTQGWGNSYTYATARLANIKVEAGKTTSIEIALKKGVKVHPVLSKELDAEVKASLTPDQQNGMAANLNIVFTAASEALSAQNIDKIFKMDKGSGDSENSINYWGNNWQDISLEPGAYNFYLVYEKQFPMAAKNQAKIIIGRAKNIVVDISKQTDNYAQNGSTMNMVTVQNIPVTVSMGAGSLSGSYSGVNTLRQADMEVINSNFNLFTSYVPRVTLIDNEGNILATGMCTPAPEAIQESGLDKGDKGAEGEGIEKIRGFMNDMSYAIGYLVPQENVKMVVTTPNYPPLVRSVKIPGTMNINMDTDVGAGAKITGTLRDTTGKAVGGASVRIKGRLLDRSVKSAADGSYLIPGLASGVYRVLVTADGYALDAEKVVIFNKDTLVNFLLTPCAGSITGTVYAQKFPYPLVSPGAQVVAYDDTANGLNPAKELAINEVVTDNDGLYKISPVIEGHTYKVALVVPGKAVEIFSPSPAVPAAPGSSVSDVNFTYKPRPPKVKLIARPDPNGASVTLQGESPRKLNSLSAKYSEGAVYGETTASPLTVSTIGQKAYSITLPDKSKAYAVRFTADNGGSTQDLDFVYNPNNSAQSVDSIDQQAVASGDVVLDSQGNDTSGLFISPGSITLGDDSIPEITINKEKRESSEYLSGVPLDEIGGDVYNIDLKMDGSQQNDNKTITLSLGYDPGSVGEKTNSLSVRQYNETTKTWEPVLGAVMVDPISNTVSVEVGSIADAAGDSKGSARKPAMAQFNGKEFTLARRASAAANQKGIFIVSKVPARMAFTGSSLEVFNVPNPFNLKEKTVTLNRGGSIPQITTNGTVIRFAVPPSQGTGVKTRFRIYNIAGELVRELNADELLAGGVNGGYYYYLDWDGKNPSGEKCASGVYFCVAEVGSEKKVVKMALIK